MPQRCVAFASGLAAISERQFGFDDTTTARSFVPIISGALSPQSASARATLPLVMPQRRETYARMVASSLSAISERETSH